MTVSQAQRPIITPYPASMPQPSVASPPISLAGDAFELKAEVPTPPALPPLLAFNTDNLKANKEWRSLVVNHYMYSSLITCGIAQFLHAFRTLILNYGLTKAAVQANPHVVAVCVGAYFGLWAAAEGIRHISLFLRFFWRRDAFLAFERRMAEINRNHVINWALDQNAKDLVGWITSQGPDGIDGYTSMLYGSVNFGISLACNGIALSQMVTPMLIPVFIGVFVGLVGYVYITNRRREKQTIKEQQTRQKLNKTINAMPDNARLPNPYNNDLWQQEFNKQEKEFKDATSELAQSSLMDSLFVLACSFVPSGCLLTYNALRSMKSAQEILNNAVNTIVVLTQFNGMMEVATSWVRAYCKMQNGFDQEDSQPDNLVKKWQKRIQTLRDNTSCFEITHNGQKVSLADLIEDPELLGQSGRFVIIAPNGSGKTTLMAAIVLYFYEKRNLAYIPPKNSLRFQKPCEGSSGQVACEQISEICQVPDMTMLLVDEWDAYLDPKNTRAMSHRLQAWSEAEDHTLIEVRQRREPY